MTEHEFYMIHTGPTLAQVAEWLMSNGSEWKIDYYRRHPTDPVDQMEVIWDLIDYANNHSGNLEVAYWVIIRDDDLAALFKLTWVGNEL